MSRRSDDFRVWGREETHEVAGTDCVVSIARVEGIHMLTRPMTEDRE